ncbi:MAG: DUF2752 domain-containing protein [Bacteroidaceae bacterium]|nr:DUF2752 domain-containing protein [Bacteroidaceae bacterium]
MKIRLFYIAILLALLALWAFMPGDWWMLSCPLYQWTGWQCPFCGAQRMMQALMHGEIVEAFSYNPLLMCTLPLMLLGGFRLLFPQIAERHPRATGRALFTDKALFVYLIVSFLWGIVRNMEKFL